MRKITDELRERLQKPFGELADSKAALEKVKARKGKLVCVGDECSHFFLKANMKPDLIVYDLRVKRQPVGEDVKAALEAAPGKLVKVKNEPGTISDAMFSAVKRGLEGKAAKILVDGEDDLAALVALMHAEDGVIVVYGQPNEGAVITVSNEETRNKARWLYG
ncbi:MAG: DUF359 domain-containing protein, partial [Candidatus Micrarchaeia archaeon]